MSIIKVPTKLQIQKSEGKGLGVFAIDNFQKDEIIEICPIIFLPKDNVYTDFLTDYRFIWVSPQLFKDEMHLRQIIPLGYGCLYNHSDFPNIAYRPHEETHSLVFYAINDIKSGEEMCHFYGGQDYWNRRPHINKILDKRKTII